MKYGARRLTVKPDNSLFLRDEVKKKSLWMIIKWKMCLWIQNSVMLCWSLKWTAVFLSFLLQNWKALEKYWSYRMEGYTMILCKWQFAEVLSSWMHREWDLFHLILDTHNEIYTSKWVTSTASGEKKTLPGKSPCYSLQENIPSVKEFREYACCADRLSKAASDVGPILIWQNAVIERFR